MYIIYHCFGGAHSSVTAASLHLGLLPGDKVPAIKDILDLPLYDHATIEDHGHLRYMGQDVNGNQVYILGRRGLKKYMPKIIFSLAQTLNIPTDKIMLVDTIPCVNWLMVLGGFTSRRMGWVRFGRPLVAKGTQRAFKNFVRLVNKTKLMIKG